MAGMEAPPGVGLVGDSARLSAWLGILVAGGVGQRGEIPAGIYRLSGTQVLQDATSPAVVGSTSYATRLEWSGAPGDPMFRLVSLTNAELAHLFVNTSIAQPCDAVFQLESGPDPEHVATRNVFHDVECEGTNGGFNYGVRWALGEGGDRNNDLTLLHNVRMRNPAVAAFRIDHSQSLQHQFTSCFGNGGQHVMLVNHGHFRWRDGAGANCTGAEFYIVNYAGGVPIVIDGHDSEGSARLVEMPNLMGQCHMTIRNARYADNKMHPDGYVVRLRGAGPFVLEGNAWRTGRLHISADGFYPIVATLRGNSYIVGPPGGPYVSPYDFGAVHPGSRITVEGELFVDSDTRPVDLSTFPDGATAPQVFSGRQFYTANTAPTVITDFRDGWHGHSFTLIAGDDHTTILAGPTLQLGGAPDLPLQSGYAVHFANDQGVWRWV